MARPGIVLLHHQLSNAHKASASSAADPPEWPAHTIFGDSDTRSRSTKPPTNLVAQCGLAFPSTDLIEACYRLISTRSSTSVSKCSTKPDWVSTSPWKTSETTTMRCS